MSAVSTLSIDADARPPPPKATSTAATPRATQNSSSRNAYRCSAKTTWIENGRRLREEDDRQQQRERHGHRDHQRLGVEDDGAVEQRREAIERRVRRREAVADELLRQRAPVLVVQVRVERRREDARVGQRLDREEDDVGEQEQLERADEGLAPALAVGQRQAARMKQQRAQAAQQTAVDAGDRLHQLRRDPLEREVDRADRALAATGTERRRQRDPAVRAGPGRSCH